MVNNDTGLALDLIDSRLKDDVIELLKKYPNIKKVTRDGSKVYASAIKEVFPEAVQVSDRFHLLQHLSGALKKDLRLLLPYKIVVEQEGGGKNRKPKAPSKRELFIKRLCEKRQNEIIQVRNRFAECPVYGIIQREFGLPYYRVKQYLTGDVATTIEVGSLSSNDKIISRKSLEKLLYGKGISDLKIKDEERELIKRYLKSNNSILKFIMLYTDFHIGLFSGDIAKLDAWLVNVTTNYSAHYNLGEFVKSICADLDAVTNSIIYAESNGITEGLITKLKMTKRTMYGRCSFPLLKIKFLSKNKSKRENFLPPIHAG